MSLIIVTHSSKQLEMCQYDMDALTGTGAILFLKATTVDNVAYCKL